MGLTYEEELTRTLDSFRAQLSFTPPNSMYGCFVNEALVSTAAVGYMWGVFTSPGYRRQGLGRQAVEAAVQHAFLNKVHRINLQVYVPNKPAVALYSSMGFIEYGVEPEAIYIAGNYYDGVHMTLLNNQV